MAITWEVAGRICRLPACNETSDRVYHQILNQQIFEIVTKILRLKIFAFLVLFHRSFIPGISSINNNISSNSSITVAPSSLPILDTFTDKGDLIHMGADCTMCKHYAKARKVLLVLLLVTPFVTRDQLKTLKYNC